MSPVPFTAMFNNQFGYFSRASQVYVDNVPGGGLAWLQVRAWDTRLGSSYEEVASLGLGGYGQSLLFQARGGESYEPYSGAAAVRPRIVQPRPGAGRVGTAGVGYWNCLLELSPPLRMTTI
jgi:hypothetical protein